MNRRILAVIVAAVLALGGGVLVIAYAKSADARAIASAQPTTVWVAQKLVPAGTKGAFPPAVRAFKGEEVKRALTGSTLPGTDAERSRAYVNYIRRLQRGQGGFTCFASLQNPR